LIRDRLALAGVSTNAIIIEPNSRNTRENAEFSVRLMKAQGARKAIVVTSWLHSRRALACFRHFSSDIEFSSFPAYQGINMDHKPSLPEVPSVLHEYLGIAWYWVRYGIVPVFNGPHLETTDHGLRTTNEGEKRKVESGKQRENLKAES
jgi:uncharacterized SAM-binding protein YcdF (DUF218 family)